MPDEVIKENLNEILKSIDLVQKRFDSIRKPDDFVLSSNGVVLLDSISMRLQVIGELLKNTYKLKPTVLDQYSGIEWSNIIRMRDLISHHYNQIDHEIIYDICKNHIPNLKKAINSILKKS